MLQFIDWLSESMGKVQNGMKEKQNAAHLRRQRKSQVALKNCRFSGILKNSSNDW